MVFYVLLRPVLMRFRVPWRGMEVARAVLTVGLLGFYMMLTGARPSVVRAVIMATLFIGSVVLQRSSHPLNTLGVAALVLLAARPTALFDVGFQLSMSAVAGIVTLQPRFAAPIPDSWRTSAASDYAVSLVVTSAAAVLATAPVLLVHFGWVSIGGLLLNVAGIPFTALGLSAALAMVVTGGVSGMAGAAFGSAADLFVQGLLRTSAWGADWLSWAGIRMANPSVWVLGALVCGIVSVAQWPRPRIRWRCIVGVLLLSTVSMWGSVWEQGGTLDVIFFDVGNGDAALVSTPLDRHILADTGPRSPSGSAASYSVIPYLKQQGIRHLDAVIVSHPDEDHLGGLPSILREVSVGRVLHNGRAVDTELYSETQELLSKKEIPSRSVQRGDEWSPSSKVRVQILGPPRPKTFDSVNEGSVAALLTYGRVKLLFPGDVEAQAEEALVRTYGLGLRSDVVKVPHHGSKTSSTPPFVDLSSDSTETHAVVSVGRENQFGMPHERVVKRWQEHTKHFHDTSTNGAVWLRTDGKSTWRVRWR
jgi:competence protein ComEC